ncbi:MAG: Uma2 family endonuclease [Leptolyngbyaceae cyanobacterium bins.302]|nr:Uma2 family endonuclease [Leptolyngbyaceae cyanobacterium bins.302]
MVETSIPRWTVPPLENGDRLDRDEFQRRYDATPNLTKAELIEGIVYMPAALRFRSHGQPHSRIMAWLVTYEAMTPGVAVGDTPTVWLDRENAPQPDAVLLITPEAGGQTQLTEDDYVEGAPELIVEIAASSVSIDLHAKKQAYCRNGVKEYIVWQVLDQVVRWFVLENSEYTEVFVNADGLFQSRVFPGLWLASTALLNGDIQQVFATLQMGLRSPEHTAFVQTLARQQS